MGVAQSNRLKITCSLIVKPLISFLVFVVFPATIIQAQQHSFSHLTVEDGLSQSSVYGIFQDSKGFLWFATADGLNRYDGKGIKIYRINENEQLHGNGNYFGNVICEDKTGTIWFSGRNGLIRYDFKKDNTSLFYPTNDTTLFSKQIEILTITPQQDLWFWNLGEVLYCYNLVSHQLKSVKIQDATLPGQKKIFRSAKIDLEGVIWYRLNTGLGSYNIHTQKFNTHLQKYAVDSKTPQTETFQFTPILCEPSGDILLSYGYSVLRFSPKTKEIKTVLYGTLNAQFNCAATDKEGNIWFGSQNNGLYHYNKKNGSIKFLTHDKTNPLSIASNTISTLFIDRSQNLWVGSDGEGLSKEDLKPAKFTHYSDNQSSEWDFSSSFIKSIYLDSINRIWIGTHDGLNIFDRKKNSLKVILDKNAVKNTIACFAKTPKGELLIGGSAGVAYINQQTFVTKYIPFDTKTPMKPGANLVFNMMFTLEGKLLVATRFGLFEGVDKDGRIIQLKRVLCVNKIVLSSIYQTKNKQIWVSNLESTFLYILHYENGKLLVKDSLLSGVNVRCFYEDTVKNTLWMASEKGLIKYDLQRKSTQFFNSINGISSAHLYAVLPDEKGNLWLSSNKGVSCFNQQKNTFTNYDNTDGLQSNEFNTGAYFRNTDGELFFGGINGFNSFYPNKINNNNYKPQVALTGFKIQDEDVPALGNTVALQQLILPFDQNTVSVDFAALEFTHPQKNSYQYILEGLDEKWVNSGNKGFTRYSGLKPGNYLFKVRASNNDGIWSDEKTLIHLIIRSPWWTSWWFIILISLVFIVTITVIIRAIFKRKLLQQQRIIEKQRAVEQERSRISKDMHDDMGSGLSKIAILSELLKAYPNEEKEAEQIEKISRTAKDLVDSMGQIIWAMNSENDKIENLTAYLREYAIDFFESSGVDCSLDFPDQISTIKLTQQQRRNIFLVVKETLNNTLKYAKASEVKLKLVLQTNQLLLVVSDNGVGFDTSQTRRFGNGLINMKKRMEEIGGSYEIESTLNEGSITMISIPMGLGSNKNHFSKS